MKRNVIFERAKFNSRNQQEGESVDSFTTELYGLARYCNFGALKEELIRDLIVVGLRNRDLSEKLQIDPKLTLEKAINLARQRETVKQQQSICDNGFKSKAANVDSIAKGKPRKKKEDNFKEKTRPSANPQSKCSRCLGSFHAKTCPARASKCRKCSEIGHRAQACRGSKQGKVFEVQVEEESFFLGEIMDLHEVQSNTATSPWTATVLVGKKPVVFKIDSSADVTVVPHDAFLNLDVQAKLQPTD